jgi:hypothetical protein
VPLWQEAPREGIQGTRLYLFGAAAVVVLIMAMMALNSLNLVRMPWQSDGYNPPKLAVTPTPQLTNRSDYARADRFLTYSLAPAINEVAKTLPAMGQACNGTLSSSCQSSLTTSEQLYKKVLVVIDRADIPPCIAPGVSRMRADFAQLDEALLAALKGFTDNKASDVSRALNRFFSIDPAMQADAKAVDLALKTQCSTDQTGP